MSTKRISSIFNTSPKNDVTIYHALHCLSLALTVSQAYDAYAIDKEPPTLGQGAPKVLKELREQVSSTISITLNSHEIGRQIKKGSLLSFNTSTLVRSTPV